MRLIVPMENERVFPVKYLRLFTRGLLLDCVSAVHAQVAAPVAFAPFLPAAVDALPAKKLGTAASGILQQAAATLTATPHPLTRIHTEGTLPHQGIRDQSIAAAADFPITLDLALVYRLTNDRRYLAAIHLFITTYNLAI